MPAPIALFVYNRPLHSRQTIEALRKNPLAVDSDLFIFSDAPKDSVAVSAVAGVRDYLRTVDGFRSVSILERERNWGLAKSIVGGVTELCERYGAAIVLEDDIVVTPAFLAFMNESLERYRTEPSVWHVSGWNYPIDSNGLPEAFLWRMMNCWGWATWIDRWKSFEKDPAALMSKHARDDQWIHRFDLEGSLRSWSQVVGNFEGRMNTWAIFWAATIFEHGGLCLNPTTSFVQNIGHDGSGVNSEITRSFSGQLRSAPIERWPDRYVENAEAVARIREFLQSAEPGFMHWVTNKFFRFSKRVKSYANN